MSFSRSEGVFIGGAGLRIACRGGLGLLPRHRFVFQKALHALLLRTGLFKGRTGRRHLQFDVPGVELGEQSSLLHALSLRNGDIEDLPRNFESEIYGVVGCSHAGKILVDEAGTRGRRDLHGTHRLGSRGSAAARPGKQGYQQNRDCSHTKKVDTLLFLRSA